MKTQIALFLVALAVPLAGPASAAEISLESAPPVVVKTVPIAGATNVDPALTEIRVTYSKAMQDGSWSWAVWAGENFPETTGSPKFLDDHRTCVLPVKLQPERFYAIWLNSDKFKDFKDTNGRPAVPYLLTFVTGKPGQSATGSAAAEQRLKAWVEDFFAHNYRDITSRDTLQWGTVGTNTDGDSFIRYKYRARIWDRNTVTNDQVFTFDAQGNFVSVKDASKNAEASGQAQPSAVSSAAASDAWEKLLNADQRLFLKWTDRQFRSFFDARTFAGWSEKERTDLETRLIDTLKGPLTREYYRAINTLAALRSTNALPALRSLAFDRADKNCRDRWMAIRGLGILGDKQSVPELIHLVYHGNVNTRWWAQISLVRLTGQNFGSDWKAWGQWWNHQNGQPPFNPEIIRWWNGQPAPDKLADSLAQSDQKFFDSIRPK